jgi:hypothetical protein
VSDGHLGFGLTCFRFVVCYLVTRWYHVVVV